MKNTEEERERRKKSVPSCPTVGELDEGRRSEGMGFEGGVRRACRETKNQEEVVWGQRWLPVCLWHMSQLALTVNAGKTTFPKAGQRRWGGGGRRQSDGC